MRAMRDTRGTASLSSSRYLPPISGPAIRDSPVRFPPGRPNLSMSPDPIGSAARAKTMGVVPFACLALWATTVPGAKITSTLRRTSSAASSPSRSDFPSPARTSRKTLLPSIYPSSASPAAGGQRVEARAVVPEDLRLRLVADPFQRQELIDRLGKQAVGVGVVRRDHDVVVPERLHHPPDDLFGR